MKYFNEKFDFESEIYDEDLELDIPSESEIFDYC